MGKTSGHEPQDLWGALAGSVRSHVGDATWNTWFEGIRALELRGNELRLAVPSRLARDRIVDQYEPLLLEALGQVAEGRHLTLAFEVVTDAGPGTDLDDEPEEPEIPEPDQMGSLTELATSRPRGGQPTIEGDALNDRYTFEHFVIGASNRFAHAAALSVAEAPARSYNPLFIYGHAGLGKTHLLHAIGHHVCQVFPGLRIRSISTETLLNEFIHAIRTNTQQDFKRRHRDVDVLLLDDIQFIENQERLQEEFFHTFNSLHNAHRQIVLTSDRPPKSMAALEDRLRSRFEWGLITDIQPPDYETRLAILQKKAESEGLGVPDDVLGFIATHIKDNIRFLEGALLRVAAYANLNDTLLSEEVARRVLADLLPSAEPRVITPGLILEETAKLFGWSVDELTGKSRRRPLVRARQISMYVFRELTDYSYPQIAKEFGGRDHTTVMHAVEKITTLMTEQQAILDQVNELINVIKHGDD